MVLLPTPPPTHLLPPADYLAASLALLALVAPALVVALLELLQAEAHLARLLQIQQLPPLLLVPSELVQQALAPLVAVHLVAEADSALLAAAPPLQLLLPDHSEVHRRQRLPLEQLLLHREQPADLVFHRPQQPVLE